jgi:hypothetical protein
MNNQETLEKAIQKAIDGGWQVPDWAQGPQHLASTLLVQSSAYTIIFNHDFARALWGDFVEEKRWIPEREVTRPLDNITYVRSGHYQTVGSKRNWKHHLQQMVIADDPIKYLGEHL